MFSSISLIVLALKFSSLKHFGLTSIHSSACGYLVFLALFAEETDLSPLNDVGTLVKDYLFINARVCF